MARRGKVQIKRIENTYRRQIAFAKRRKGFFKKAHELSVLCDVEVALVVFSDTGKAYEFSSGNSMSKILERYWTNKLHSQKMACGIDPKAQKYHPECAAPSNGSNNLQYSLQRLFEGLNVEHFSAIDIVQLEQQLYIALRQTQDLKAQLMMQSVGSPP